MNEVNSSADEKDLILSLLEVPFQGREESEKCTVLREGRPVPKFSLLQKGKYKSSQHVWYTKRKWLCGSAMKSKLFCWPCLLLRDNKFSVWVSEGYSDIKNLSRAMDRHENSREHIMNYVAYKSLFRKMFNKAELSNEKDKLQKNRYNEEVKKNREVFKVLIDVACVLCKQQLPFRENEETLGSQNSGSFWEIFNLVISGNEELMRYWEKSEYFRALSATIQHEVLECIQEEIQNFISKSINEAPFYACYVNDITDITEISQCSVIVRLVDSAGDVQQFFLGLYDKIEEKTAVSVCGVLYSALEKYDIQNKLVAYTYDGACVISRQLQELNSLVNECSPIALFTHCFTHNLNSIIQQSCSSIKSVKLFFSYIQGISAFFHQSPKRIAILSNVLDECMPTYSKIGWNCDAKIILAIYDNRLRLIKVFSELADSTDSNAATVREAEGYKDILQEPQFLFLLSIFNVIFPKTELLFQTLQENTNDIQKCKKAALECMRFIKSLKKRDNYALFLKTAKFSTGITLTKSQKEKFQFEKVYYELLDHIYTQLEVRFSNCEKLSFLSLGQTSKFLEYHTYYPSDAVDSLIEIYGTIFNQEKLQNELKTIFLPLYEETFQGLSLSGLIKTMIDNETNEILTEAFKLFCLILTIPATSVSVMDNFPCLAHVETFLRNYMTQDRFTKLACVPIEKNILNKLQNNPTWHVVIIERFAKEKDFQGNLTYK